MKFLLNKKVILIISTAIISWGLASDSDESSRESGESSGASSGASSSSTASGTSSGSSTSASSSSSSSSTSSTSGESDESDECDECKKCNDAPNCPCFDLNYCPLEYSKVCAYNGVCYRVFRSKCEIEDLNSYAEDGDKKWKIQPITKCRGAPIVTGCNNCQNCVSETNSEVCGYSCLRGCYRNFNSYCQLPQQNCNHPFDDYYTFYAKGKCEDSGVVLCVGNVGLT